MKKGLLLLLLATTMTTLVSAQFVSVNNGDWRDPKTWSTDLQATAIPNSLTDVIIQHTVVMSSVSEDCRCNNLFITEAGTLVNYSSTWTSSNLIVEKDVVNRGTLKATHDYFILNIKGNLYNHGTITKLPNASHFDLQLTGNLTNNGSFRGFNSIVFQGNGSPHTHMIKSQNDSTIYLSVASLSDSQGMIVIDSTAIINGNPLNLKQGSLVIPPIGPWETKMVCDGGSIEDGTIIANGNKIHTKPGTWLGFNKNYSPDKDVIIQNAELNGDYRIGGASSWYGVVLKGKNTLTGKLIDWYSGSYASADDRGLRLEGEFINEGTIFNATSGTGWGMWIIQMPGSIFINKRDSLNIEAHKFVGSCTFSSTGDTLITPLWEGKDTSTIVNLLSDIHFRKTVRIDMNGGTLALPPQGLIKALTGDLNMFINTKVEANGAQIRFPCTWQNVTYNNPNFLLTYFRHPSVLTGQVTVTGTIAPYYNYYPTVTIDGSIHNKGSIINHPQPQSGDLSLEVTGNIVHDGIAWKNQSTKLNGIKHQFIILPNDSIIKGAVYFEAVLTGSKYQWKKDGLVINGATNSQLAFSSGINSTHYGVYQCFIDDSIPSRTITVGREIPPAFRIYDVQIKNIGLRSTLIQWKTTTPARGFVFYAENDLTNGYPLEAPEADTLVTVHQLQLDSLTRGSTYYFIIDQFDQEWNDIRSEEFRFVAGELAVGAVSISKIWDVPDDQGRWVHVQFEADMLDQMGEIRNYGIWERMENEWVSLGSVQATQSPSYTFLAKTYGDSTSNGIYWSTFRITAHTTEPLIYFTSPSDSGYSVDNLVPSVPTGLIATTQQQAVSLDWNPNPDPDIQYYVVYRDDIRYEMVKENAFIDKNLNAAMTKHDYQISAVDFNGNESLKSAKVSVTIVGLVSPPKVATNLSNSPNPFNESTCIRFNLDVKSFVELRVFDLTGKVITTLLNGSLDAGNHKIDYKTDLLEPGIYLYRLKTEQGTYTNRMMKR